MKLKIQFNTLVAAFLFCVSVLSVHAQTEEHEELNKAADNATNPLAFVTKIQSQPNYTFLDNGGDKLDLVLRILQPTPTIGLPFIKSKDPSKVYTIYRLESPIISQTVPGGFSDATGIADMVLVDVIAFKQKWGLLGIGPAITIPTASSNFLGSGKWSAGLAGTFLFRKIPKWTMGVLAQQYISFAGDSNRNDVNRMLFQPVITKVFGKGLFLNFSPDFVFDWENDTYSIPIGLNFGKAFSKNLSMYVGPEYVASGPNKGNFTIRFNINAMFTD